ncbi:uncharacterized protein LOC118755242, partial [Rhagoletis pomonella]|uniref:uncharacterized protein LOC118755242 n=1 Tax=Rhagoletis pomonella TaxID=28610 RepID=UPI001783CC6E
DELPNAEVLKIKIIEESEARKQTSGGAVIAMAAGNRVNCVKRHVKKNEKNASKAIFKCFKCGAPGHKANVCKARKGENSNHLKQSNHEVNESYAVCHTAAEQSWDGSHTHRANHTWVLDSGCTAHLCGDVSSFSFISKSSKAKLNLASQACADVKGKGIVQLRVAGDDGERQIEFKNTLFVPDLRTNLISVAKITDKGQLVMQVAKLPLSQIERAICTICVKAANVVLLRKSVPNYLNGIAGLAT